MKRKDNELKWKTGKEKEWERNFVQEQDSESRKNKWEKND